MYIAIAVKMLALYLKSSEKTRDASQVSDQIIAIGRFIQGLCTKANIQKLAYI